MRLGAMRHAAGGGLGVIGLLVAANAWAHHSFAAIWDEKKSFTASGTLEQIDWINPHSYVYVEVMRADGGLDKYSFEGFPPSMLRSYGLNKDMFSSRIGQKVTVTAYPAKDGTKTLGFGRTYQFADGYTIVTVRDPADIPK